MKRLKMKSFIILFACLLCVFCIPMQAGAEETAVPMVTIDSLADLQTHIDNDGAYSSQSQPKNETSPTVYKITVQEAGYIVLRGYTKHDASWHYADINLYSNASLISKLDSTLINANGDNLIYYVQKGSYYYTVTSSYDDLTATVYVGFSPCPETVTTVPLVLSNLNNTQELQTHIDTNGKYSSQDKLGKNNLAPDYAVHKISITEPGFLVIKGYANESWCTSLELYSDKNLTSKLASTFLTTTGSNFLVQYLQKGDYYFKLNYSSLSNNIVATVYAGFAPRTAKTTSVSLSLSNMNKKEDLQTHIDTNGKYSSQDKLGKNNLALDYAVHKISITEPGFLVIKGYASESWCTSLALYSDKNLTSKLDSTFLTTTGSNYLVQYLEKGEYYYKLTYGSSSNNIVATVYTGLIPSKNFIKVKSINLSKDKASATINFTTSLKNATIKVVKRNVSYADLKNNNIWNASNVLSCTSKLKLTANGNYTARISVDGSDDMYTVKFKVSGIKNSKPTKPKVTAYKRNTKVVKGKTTAYTTVYVKIGSKLHKATADKKGQFTVKTSKLKKKAKISIYAQNSAGTKSKTKTVTVK